jgi:hypothetical protein
LDIVETFHAVCCGACAWDLSRVYYGLDFPFSKLSKAKKLAAQGGTAIMSTSLHVSVVFFLSVYQVEATLRVSGWGKLQGHPVSFLGININRIFFAVLFRMLTRGGARYMAGSKDHRHLLKHPVITSFLCLKWSKLSSHYNSNLAFYSLLGMFIEINVYFSCSQKQIYLKIYFPHYKELFYKFYAEICLVFLFLYEISEKAKIQGLTQQAFTPSDH